MKRFFFLLVFVQFSFSQMIQNTRGGWFNMGLQGTGGSTSLEGPGFTGEFSGIGLGIHSRGGVMLTPVWILSFDLDLNHMVSPDYSENSVGVPWSGNSLTQVVAGPGATFFVSPEHQIVLGATLGLSYFFQMNSDYGTWDESKVGWALALRVGKYWTINPGTLMGLSLDYSYATAGVERYGISHDYRSNKIGLNVNFAFGNRCVLNPKETSKYRDCMNGY